MTTYQIRDGEHADGRFYRDVYANDALVQARMTYREAVVLVLRLSRPGDRYEEVNEVGGITADRSAEECWQSEARMDRAHGYPGHEIERWLGEKARGLDGRPPQPRL